jgi:hypothetical protein
LGAWNPNSANDGMTIYALASTGTNIAVGGTFQEIGGQLRQNIAVVDATSGLADSWDASAYFGAVYGSQVSAIASNGDTIYVAGQFDTVNGQPRDALAALTSPDLIFRDGFE